MIPQLHDARSAALRDGTTISWEDVPMPRYRHDLPQLTGGLFLTDGGIETDLIFNQGISIREFAAHTLLADARSRNAVATYFRDFLQLARSLGTGFVLDSQTWKAHSHWASDLGSSEEELRQSNRESVDFISELREEFSANDEPIVLNGIIGPQGDAYAPQAELATHEAENYHAQQLGWLAETEIDMVTATTFTQADEAIGFVRAANKVGLPAVISFTVETDGKLPTGLPLSAAIEAVDAATDACAAYYMVNCAHPDHFFHELEESPWAHRIRGLRCNASRLSHAELDACETLDSGNPVEMAQQYAEIRQRLPWINVFGGCCGSDFRHIREIARSLLG
jgi:S-methylmethionine-dependent homocysteine/selenocysteine methylase